MDGWLQQAHPGVPPLRAPIPAEPRACNSRAGATRYRSGLPPDAATAPLRASSVARSCDPPSGAVVACRSHNRRGPPRPPRRPRVAGHGARRTGALRGTASRTRLLPRADGAWRMRLGSSADDRLDSEPGATLGATRAQHPAPAGGLHSAAKTVGALAADDRRLVSAFHDRALFGKSLILERFAYPAVKVNHARRGVRCCG